MKTPRTAFGDYLRAGAAPSAVIELSAIVAETDQPSVAELLAAYGKHGVGWHSSTTGPAAGKKVFVAPRPPDDEVGVFWFDTCDLSLMLCLAKYVDPETFDQMTAEARARLQPTIGWLAMEPVLGWQFGAFCDVAPIRRIASPSCASFVPLDPGRIDLDGGRPVTSVSCPEAALYLTWFGKLFPHEAKWQQVRRQLGDAPWSLPAREWAGAAAFDDGVYIVLTPQNIDTDLAELAMTPQGASVLYGSWDTPSDVTFRSQIERAYGLDTGEIAPREDESGLKLERLFARPTNQ